jgi:hypothetical protein
MTDDAAAQARRDARNGYQALEPLHAFIYFDTGAAERYAAAGVTDPYEQYFGSRSAAMGAVGPGVVVATFFNFNPQVVHGAIPAVWSHVSPETLLAARHDAARDVYARVFGDDEDTVAAATGLLAEAVEAIRPMGSGRALYAGLADLPEPTDPLRLLWHRIALVREWRGDGHVAALTAAGVDPCEVLHVHAATGAVNRDVLKLTRGWSDAEWDAARDRLVDRGEMTPDGELTETGQARRQEIEDTTDALAVAPWLALGTDRSQRLRDLLTPYARKTFETSGMAAMVTAAP